MASWTAGRPGVLDFLCNNINTLLSLTIPHTCLERYLETAYSLCGFVLMSQLAFLINIAFMYCILPGDKIPEMPE